MYDIMSSVISIGVMFLRAGTLQKEQPDALMVHSLTTQFFAPATIKTLLLLLPPSDLFTMSSVLAFNMQWATMGTSYGRSEVDKSYLVCAI